MTFTRTLATLALAVGFLHASAAAAGGLDIRLEALADKTGGAPGVVRYQIANQTRQDLLVLSWETPLRGVEGDLFEVFLDGKPVRYVGREYKRGLPQAEDYVELKAGQALSVDIDLTAYYEMRAPGTYRVQALGHFHDTFAVRPAAKAVDEALLPIGDKDAVSQVVSLWVDGVAFDTPTEPVGVLNLTKAGSISYVGCSNTQANGASAGHSAAQTMAADSNSYLAAGLRGARYTTWFGTWSSTNYNTLKSNFTKIADALNNKPVQYNCGCTSSAFAYVYPTRPYEIFLCNAFWQANTTGTDSKGGTVIHELSHFDIVANTDDLAYGQTACKKLASNAKRAIKNADSHEYFAENTPRLN